MDQSPPKKSNLYIFAGGGSGGHLFPGLAVQQSLRLMDPDADILFLCTDRDIDKTILQAGSQRYQPQSLLPLPGLLQFKAFWPFWKSWRANVESCRTLFQQTRPAAVLGLGGFACAPALKTAYEFGIPAAMLNPDAIPGKANRFCHKYADVIFLQWGVSKDYFGSSAAKCQVVGCPVRNIFIKSSKELNQKEKDIVKATARHQLGLNPTKQTLLVMGGSLGGHNINAAVALLAADGKSFQDHGQDWQLVHITGRDEFARIKERYNRLGLEALVIAFTLHPEDVFLAADLVIARAGASTLAELVIMALPSILLPYPYHKDQHQLHNAEVLTRAEAAQIVIDDCDVQSTARRLDEVLGRCFADKALLERMGLTAGGLAQPNAADQVARSLLILGRRQTTAAQPPKAKKRALKTP